MRFFSRLPPNYRVGDHKKEYDESIKKLFEIGCVCMFVFGIVSDFLFGWIAPWSIVVDSIIAASAAIAYFLSKKRFRIAAILVLAIGIYSVTLFSSIYCDIPSNGAPRSLHHTFLMIACAAYLILIHEAFLRLLIAGVSLLTYLFFASSNWGIPDTPYNLIHYYPTHTARILYAWGYNISILVGILIMFYFAQANSKKWFVNKADLLNALIKNEFELYYQPQATPNQILGAEALIRWNHPIKGMISPDDFISLAEELHLMLPLGKWVLTAACERLIEWSKNPLTANLVLSINVSVQEFNEESYVPQVLAIINKAKVNPARLKLELTESLLAHDLDEIILKMNTLRRYGFNISLDDFGTGYSSLSYLKNLPLDQVKIDRAFIKDILSSESDQAIAQTIIGLTKLLHLDVIAEGVETEEQYEFLLTLGCSAIQGYLLSRPLPAQQFNAFVNNFYRKVALREQSLLVDLE